MGFVVVAAAEGRFLDNSCYESDLSAPANLYSVARSYSTFCQAGISDCYTDSHQYIQHIINEG